MVILRARWAQVKRYTKGIREVSRVYDAARSHWCYLIKYGVEVFTAEVYEIHIILN